MVERLRMNSAERIETNCRGVGLAKQPIEKCRRHEAPHEQLDLISGCV
jgi:hypothetical protein